MPRTDTARLVVDASPASVYAALVDPAAVTEWLPPRGMTGVLQAFDPRPGGSYRMVLTHTDASAGPGKSTPDADVVVARFVQLIANRRVRYSVAFDTDDAALAGTMTLTWELTEEPGGTRVEVTAVGVPDAISAEDHVVGMTSSLENLARYVAPQAPSADRRAASGPDSS